MTPEKMLTVVAMYEERLQREGIPRKRMDPRKKFSELSDFGKLSHAHWLVDGVREYVRSTDTKEKANRHLGSIQTLLGCVGWYTLEELMEHSRPETPQPNASQPERDPPYERTHKDYNHYKRY